MTTTTTATATTTTQAKALLDYARELTAAGQHEAAEAVYSLINS
jgi:thioredoxin-like negative regulator of GroEL